MERGEGGSREHTHTHNITRLPIKKETEAIVFNLWLDIILIPIDRMLLFGIVCCLLMIFLSSSLCPSLNLNVEEEGIQAVNLSVPTEDTCSSYFYRSF